MEVNQYIKDFFIDNEKAFNTEQIESLIQRCSKFSKLIGKEGNVHIVKKELSIVNKVKLFLITRYLGSELSKLKPSLGIKEGIEKVSNAELSKFLTVSSSYASAVVSKLVYDGFVIRVDRGFFAVSSTYISDYIGLLEKEINDKGNKKWKKEASRLQGKKIKQKKETIDITEIYKKLSEHLKINENFLKDSIFLNKDGSFKFNKEIPGKSKNEKQANCILCTAYIETIGLGKRTFTSNKIKNVCFNSNIDIREINQAIKYLKNYQYISKAARHSRENILLEKGKSRAIKILNEVCK
jgi:hypothetical protein